MGRGKSCAALAAGARSTHYVQLRVEIAGKESNKQEGREEVYSKKRKQMNNPATRSRQEWRSNGRRRTQHTLRIYIQLRVEIAVKESNKWYLQYSRLLRSTGGEVSRLRVAVVQACSTRIE